ncbi:MAG: hypothetical protein JO368_03145 [Acidimicrobiales bacterium]|nr:hypothetical protein [Acidimicrobiales bacterium]
MDEERQELLDSIDECQRLVEELGPALRASRRYHRTFRSRIERGESVVDALTAIPTGDLRRGMTQLMADIEAARHRVRRATIALGLEEGMSIGELGRLWGFSRQLAARYAKEVRDVDGASKAS